MYRNLHLDTGKVVNKIEEADELSTMQLLWKKKAWSEVRGCSNDDGF